jgi:hypothetical protein
MEALMIAKEIAHVLRDMKWSHVSGVHLEGTASMLSHQSVNAFAVFSSHPWDRKCIIPWDSGCVRYQHRQAFLLNNYN